MAASNLAEIGPSVEPPLLSSNATTASMELYVDVAGLIDIPMEIQKQKKDIEKYTKLIKSKEAKLSGDFVTKAPAQVVEKERTSLSELQTQLNACVQMLQRLEASLGTK